MGGKNAAARPSDVRHLRQQSRITQEARQAEVVQRRAESSAGKRKADFFHCRLLASDVSGASRGELGSRTVLNGCREPSLLVYSRRAGAAYADPCGPSVVSYSENPGR